MDQNPRNQQQKTILDTLGEEIVRIITPVSICMFLVVILVSILQNDSDSTGPSISTIATLAYDENISDTLWDKFKGALLNSLVFVAVVTVVTFFLVLLFYLRCTKFLKYYMGFSSFLVLCFMGGEIAVLLAQDLDFPVDCVTFMFVLVNFSVVGVLAVFMSKFAILVTQGYLVVIGVLVSYWFTLLPEWTTWVLLVAMALYDLAAVLLPVGPLRILVELAISRDEDIPALVYEARPIEPESSGNGGHGVMQRRVWRERRGEDSTSGDGATRALNMGSEMKSDESFHGQPKSIGGSNLGSGSGSSSTQSVVGQRDRSLVDAEEGRAIDPDSELAAPLIQHRINVRMNSHDGPDEAFALEGIGLATSGAIKLGLGDFIFYSVLVGRAAMYDFMAVYACYLAIIAGLGVTLMLLAFYQKALPALPFSVMLGVLFYLFTRLLLEEFVVQCSINLLMF
ncbi:aspartic protease [Lithospermum erythrorhizon]|uniref:Presenilin n=1 Tax=Lithospermum erythrorhizon TaxID=34254 RepID=A0AAV3P6M0_LITER